MFVGATLGIRLSKTVDENVFKKTALLLVLITGAMSILTALNLI